MALCITTTALAEPGVVWMAQPVRLAAPEDIGPAAPFVPAAAGDARGAVSIGPTAAAALWLDPLELVRVRVVRGQPRFARIVGESGARAVLDEPGVAAARGEWYLAQPPGRGDVWMIAARQPAAVIIERPVRLRGRQAWDGIERDVLAWIDAGGDAPPPALPIVEGANEARLRLVAEAQLAGLLGARLARASLAWRKASALSWLTALRPLAEGPFALAAIAVPGARGEATLALAAADGDDARPWQRLEGGRSFTVDADGAGALRLEARPLLGGALPAPAAVSILAGDVLLGRAAVDADPVATPDATTPPPAFPSRTPLVTRDGAPVGARAAVTVPLATGRRLTLRVEGGPLLVRALSAVRRPRLGHGGRASPAALIGEARRALDATAPGADLLVAELARLEGRAAAPVAAGAAPGELGWVHLVDAARGLAGRGDSAGLRTLLAGLREAPPPEVLALLAGLLPEPTLGERLRGARIAALDVAWRGRPLDPQVAAAARAAWRAGAWSLVPPDDDLGERRGAVPRPRSWSWLVESEADPLSPGGGLTRLTPGRARRVVAPPAPGDATRAARLLVQVVTDADVPGPLTLRVDGASWSTLALEPVETLEVAVAPGEHEVTLAGPAGTRAYANLPALVPAVEPRADVRRYFPLASDGKATRWQLPDPAVPGPVRVSVRALDPVPGEPIRVALRADVGERRTFTFIPGGVDARAFAVDAPGRVSGEASFVVRLPTNAREVWLSASGTQPLVVALAVRRDGDAAPLAVPPYGADDDLARVAALSRELARAPDAGRLLERAARLLDLDQPELARQDLLRVSSTSLPPALVAAANELIDRVEDAGAHLRVAAPLPTPLAPGLLGLAEPGELASLAPAVRALRRLGPAEARAELPEGDGAALAYLRARLAPQPLALAEAASEGFATPMAIEAAERLGAALEARSAPRGAAALLFGLATRLRRAADHPRVRRALNVAAALSRWDAIEGTERNAGQERLTLIDAAPATAAALAREALLPTPWSPRRAHTLVPGAAAALELELSAATRISAQVLCVELKVSAPPPSCVVSVSLDGQELRARAAAGGGVGVVPPRTLAAGRHQIAVTLSRDEPAVLASVRFIADRPLLPGAAPESDGGYAVPLERAVRSFVAAGDRAVELAVLGPTTLRLELRSAGGPAAAIIESRPPRGAERLEKVVLDAAADATARGEPGRDVVPGRATETQLVLAAPGAHRVKIAAGGGRVLVRLAMRQDVAAAPPPLPAPWWEEAPPSRLLPWPGAAPPLATVDGEVWSGCPPSSLGTLSVALSGGSEPVGERDAPLAAFLGTGQLELSLRRRLGEALWLRVAATARAREATPAIAGLEVDGYARDLPLSLRAALRGAAFTQSYAGEQAASLVASLRLDRSFDLGRTLSWVPSLSLRGAWLSLDRMTVVAAGDDVDPDVYTDYLRTHPVQLTARAALWWAPFADQVGQLAAFVASTREIASVDYFGAELEWRSLFPILGETAAALSYRPSYRVVTADRPAAFLRHDVAARLRWSVWTGDRGRFVVGVDGWLVANPDAGARAGATLVVGYDWTLGRGLMDILPLEESFESLVERRQWERP